MDTKKKILVVDDQPNIAMVLKIRLKVAGYEILTAHTSEEGLQLALESKPDLIISDIFMPPGGGFSLAYRLREQMPEVPLIFMTASRQEGLRETAAKFGAVGFFEKPYEPEELLAVVLKALSK